jgi:hypothetical protein
MDFRRMSWRACFMGFMVASSLCSCLPPPPSLGSLEPELFSELEK